MEPPRRQGKEDEGNEHWRNLLDVGRRKGKKTKIIRRGWRRAAEDIEEGREEEERKEVKRYIVKIGSKHKG